MLFAFVLLLTGFLVSGGSEVNIYIRGERVALIINNPSRRTDERADYSARLHWTLRGSGSEITESKTRGQWRSNTAVSAETGTFSCTEYIL